MSCRNCKAPTSEYARDGLCKSCRKKKCKKAGCETFVIPRAGASGFCFKHSGRYEKNKPEDFGFGVGL